MMNEVPPEPDPSGPALRGTLVHAHQAAAKAYCLRAKAHLASGDHRRLALALMAARLHISDAMMHSGVADRDYTAACDLTRSLAWKLMGGNVDHGDCIREHLDVLERLIGTFGLAEPRARPHLRLADRPAD